MSYKSTNLNETLLSSVDISNLDYMDPKDGFKIKYDKEIPFELRIQEEDAISGEGTLEKIHVKILVKSTGDKNQDIIKIELSSEADLFFHYSSSLNINSFNIIKNQQNLNINFGQYLQRLEKILELCHQQPQKYFAVFFMQIDGTAKLEFIENLDYKYIELFSVEFLVSSEETIRQCQNFYCLSNLKIQNNLTDINNLIKIKNPSLLMLIQKGTTKQKTGINFFDKSITQK